MGHLAFLEKLTIVISHAHRGHQYIQDRSILTELRLASEILFILLYMRQLILFRDVQPLTYGLLCVSFDRTNMLILIIVNPYR